MSTSPKQSETNVIDPATRRTSIREMFAVIDAADWSALRGFLHPDVVYDRPGYESLIGLERMLKFYEEERIIASGVHSLDGIVVEHDAGAAWGSLRGTLKDGSDTYVKFADIYSFDGDALKTRISYFFQPAV